MRSCAAGSPSEHPELVSHADELVAASAALDGFLETPAFVLAAQHLAEEEPPLAAGTLVGPYRIVSLLARGGMGDVYRATDPRLRRDVALKMLAGAGRDDGHRVERFLQEARLTASLDHPNIVKVFDVGVFRTVVPIWSRNCSTARRCARGSGRRRCPPAATPSALRRAGARPRGRARARVSSIAT